MHSLKNFPFILLFSLLLNACVSPETGQEWEIDFEKAKIQAKKQNKHILLYFTGSDWCGYCVQLHKNVLSKKDFQEYAKETFVLVKIDFPRRKKLEEKTQKQNEELAKKYKINAVPIIIILDSNANQVGVIGYKRGGTDAYIKFFKKTINTSGKKI
jgi:thioredoxin-related protein